MELARKNIANIKPYIAGKPIEETKRELKLKEVIKLASNENPLGPSPRAVAAVKKALKNLHRYPDANSFYLKRALAKYYKVEPDQLVLGNGSDELIDVIIKTFVEDDENIVTADVTFLEYKIIASVNNKEVRSAPLNYLAYDLEALKRKIDRKTKLVFIANPNNPTGTYVSRSALEEFLKGLPQNTIVVMDEAYDTFVDADDFPNSSALITKNNIIVLKTFSKGFGLAGLRIGVALTSADFAGSMEKVRQPFNVNLLAQVAAEAALSDKEFLKKTRQTVLEGKEYLYRELANLGIAYVPSVANFILVDVGRDCVGVFKEMLKFGVIVRDMKQYDLANFIRVTIGTKKENQRFIRVLKKVLA